MTASDSLGRVLLIEDEPDHAELVQRAFEMSMHRAEVVWVESLSAASERMSAADWDLVIADWKLPDGDALSFLQRLEKPSQVPFLVMTSHGDERLAVDVIHAGAIDYVVKSAVAFREMPHTALRALREARQRHELAVTREQLGFSEALFEAVVRAVPDIIYRLDSEGHITFISHAVTRYGWEPEELLGRHVLELVHPDDRDVARFRLNERRTGERASRLTEFRLLTKDAGQRNFELHSQPAPMLPVMLGSAEGLYASETPCAEAFLGTQGIARDITDRKAAEEEVRRLAAAVQGSSDALLIIEDDGTVSFANEAFETITGLKVSETVGRPSGANVLSTSDDPLLRAVRASQVEGQTWVWRGQAVFTSGRDPFLDISGTRLTDERGEQSGFVVRVSDITEQVRLERQLEQAARLEALATLAGGIAHDFNNVLAAIMGYAELAAMRLEPEHEVQEDLEQILIASQRAGDVTRQILAFARQSDQQRRLVDLVPLVRESIKLLRATLPPTISVVDRVERGLPLVLADASQLHQVVMNLCTNAVHAMEDSPGTLTVAMRASAAPAAVTEHGGAWLALEIRDTGSGIGPEALSRIFEPFFTTKPAGRGTGLGLSMVHGIISNHGGAIEVESDLGHGSVFRVYLPGAEGEAASPPEAPAAAGEPARVLLVDDELSLGRMLQRMLEADGHQVRLHHSALEALSDRDPVDVAVVDQVMPEMSGLELIRRLRVHRPGLPAVLLTGYADDECLETAAGLGATAVLRKPIRLHDLAAELRRAIEPRPAGP